MFKFGVDSFIWAEVFTEKDLWIIPKAKELGLPLYSGEFGVYFDAPESDMLRWYSDVIQLFEENNIGYANWNYKRSGFGLVDYEGKRYEELIRVMTRQ